MSSKSKNQHSDGDVEPSMGEAIRLRLRQCRDDFRACTPRSCARATCKWIMKNLLLVLLLTFMIGGIITGLCMKAYGVSFTQRQLKYFGFPGEILMRLLKMIIIPLIVSSLMAGLANLDLKTSGKIGVRACTYYVATTLIAVVLGIVLVQIIRPGERVDGAAARLPPTSKVTQVSSIDAMMDLVRNVFPDNLIEACFRLTTTKFKDDPTKQDPCKNCQQQQPQQQQQQQNPASTRTVGKDIVVVKRNDSEAAGNGTGYNITVANANEREIKVETTDGMNIMGLVTFSVAFGMIISSRKSECRALIEFVKAVELVTMRLVMIIMWYSPVGVFFLIATKIVEMESGMAIFQFLAYYSITVLAGLFIHGLILLPLLYFAITKKNPLSYISGIMPALVTAVGTSSSSATLPMTFRCLEETNGIDKRVTRFVLPIGATINMDGTALYEAVAPIFIAQVRRIEMSFVQIIAISITATFASIGAAGIPQAGLVTMVMVLSAVGLEPQDVTLIIAVDWFLDRFRTMINVLGDSIGAGIVQHLSKQELAELPVLDEEYIHPSHHHGHHHNADQQRHDGDGDAEAKDKLLQVRDLESGRGAVGRPAEHQQQQDMKPLVVAKRVNEQNQTATTGL